MSQTLGALFLKDIEAEIPATRKCLERIPESLFAWKPHEKSMEMGYLAILVTEMPRWITHMIEKGDIELGTFGNQSPKTTTELVKTFDDNTAAVKTALENVSDEALKETFHLKNQGKVLFSAIKEDNIPSTIRHWTHHRGQLTVYMRLNDIAVPSIYGPSADDKSF
jgi:uncharacterized damage-inducible protein DinB